MEDSQIGNIIISIVTGLIFSLSGFIMKRKPPKDINALIGYRTKRSMKNQLLWDEANKYSAEIMLRYGLDFAITGILLSIIFEGISTTFVILGLVLILIVFMIVKVEKRLKQLDRS